MEALLGVGWLHLHGGSELMSPKDVHYWGLNIASAACVFVREHGATVLPWVAVLEDAILGYECIWLQCPWIQCISREYKPELQSAHIEALRLGFPSGVPFHSLGIPVLPDELWNRYLSDEVVNQLNEATRRPTDQLN